MGKRPAVSHPGRYCGKSVTNSLMTYHGRPISTAPVVYINYWGSQWNTGFTTGGYTSGQAQTSSMASLAMSAGPPGRRRTRNTAPASRLARPTAGPAERMSATRLDCLAGLGGYHLIPRRISESNIASAATRLMNHFGYSANAIYFVMTPSGHSMNGFGTQWCAWHDNTNTSFGQMAYAYQPYAPDAGSSCGMNFVNGTNNSFGNGYFDGFSITGGHEWIEARTDMTPSTSIAWQGPGGGSDENGDKCAWNNNGGVSGNISLGGHNYAVQPDWSNNSTTGTGSHCVMSHT